MAILIDPPLWPAHGTRWSHLVSDSDYGELHEFARRLGIPRRGFDLDHYDVPESQFEAAQALGARVVGARELLAALRDSGLRVRQVNRAAARLVRRREYLQTEWQALGMAIGADGDQWQGVLSRLIARWSEPHRTYHDVRHLEDVLLALDQLSVRGEDIASETLLAAWFHDAVYQGDPSDEAESAALAVSELQQVGLDSGLMDRVREHILATSPSNEITDPPPVLAHLLDADLWIFAAGRERYEGYRDAVRAEYAHVSEADFAVGRAAILRGYLERPRIYFTPFAQELWEARARRNLSRELGLLI